MKMRKILFTGIAIAVPLLLTGCPAPNDPAPVIPAPTAVTFESAVQTGGTTGTVNSTALTLSFSVDPTTLAAGDITVTGATKGALSGTGKTRTLAISNITVSNGATVSVAVTNPIGFAISGSSQTAVVYNNKVYNLRETGPAGGLIFYDKGSYSDGWRYLEAWTADESGTYQWKTSNTSTAGTSTAIGTGYTNTYIAMTGTEHPAANVARTATHGGYSDWFLPSKDELNQMYVNLKSQGVSVFDTVYYWSSSAGDTGHAWAQSFNIGFQDGYNKIDALRVRVVRIF